tara:strand:- start:4533 stop:4754 length:222 start_codon:yes stop_codon:yes gene_type:complete
VFTVGTELASNNYMSLSTSYIWVILFMLKQKNKIVSTIWRFSEKLLLVPKMLIFMTVTPQGTAIFFYFELLVY